jgi:ATP phosphoribosyltransferase
MINIGVPSKGRLRKDSLNLFIKKKLKIISRQGKRDLFANIKNLNDVRIVYLHAREIIERLSENSLDIGISGYDLLMEAGVNYQKKIYLKKKLNFGKAQLVIAIPNKWIDVQTIADLEEVAFIYRDKYKRNLRVATKYPNLTTKALFLKGVTQFRLVKSLGATEIYPFTGSS